jgi:hypothetical protein
MRKQWTIDSSFATKKHTCHAIAAHNAEVGGACITGQYIRLTAGDQHYDLYLQVHAQRAPHHLLCLLLANVYHDHLACRAAHSSDHRSSLGPVSRRRGCQPCIAQSWPTSGEHTSDMACVQNRANMVFSLAREVPTDVTRVTWLTAARQQTQATVCHAAGRPASWC